MKKQDALAYFESAAELVRTLADTPWPITPQGVSEWPEEIPWGRAYQLESVTGGELRAE